MKKIIPLMLVLIMALSLTACSGNNNPSTINEDSSSNSSEDASVSSKESQSIEESNEESSAEEKADEVKNDGYEKFSQLKIGMTENEVNAILGEPAKIDKAYYYYDITVNGKPMELEVWINTVSGLVTHINGNFSGNDYRTEFMDSKTDLSKVDDLESGEINTYDECTNTFKTPGFLMSIDKDGTTSYLWVNSNDGYLRVTFREDGTVKTYAGFC